MTRTIAYFPYYCAQNSQPVIAAVAQAVANAGLRLVADAQDADACLIWSVLWHGRMRHNQQIYQTYRSSGRPVIVIDVGTIIRGTTWKIAIDNINARGYYGHTQDLDLDRPKKLGMISKTSRTTRPDILIAAQHRHSLQVESIDMESWITESHAKLRQHTDRSILLRPHPRSPINRSKIPADLVVQDPQKVPGTYDNFDFDTGYHAVVNYNSGPGIIAAIQGIRPVVDVSSLAAPVGVSPAQIELPYEADRSQWLIEIAHTEYTVEEIAQGTWLKRLNSRLQLLP